MKYEYGVEYPTDGVEPDLPDDVFVEQYSTADEKWHKGKVSYWNWQARTITKFRIVDERYKPSKSSWHERGELPPVGARFEAYFERDDRPKWNAGIVEYKSDEHVILIFDDGDENYYETSRLKKIAKFRPIRTEREKAIEAAIPVVERSKFCAFDALAAELYDAGLLRLPEGK